MKELSMKRIVAIDQSETRRRIIKNESLFQDTFSCVVGEHRCPIKRQNTEYKLQVNLKDEEIHTLQDKFEVMEKQAQDELLAKKGGPEKAEAILRLIKESKAIAERDARISQQEIRMRNLQGYIDQLQEEIKALDGELEDYKTTAFEADIKQRQKVQEYRQLSRKCDELFIRITGKENVEKLLDQEIARKKAYDAELTKLVNLRVDELNLMGKELARFRVEHGRLQKEKPAGERKGFFRRFRFKIARDNAQAH